MRSCQSATLHRELEEQAIREESKSHHDFLSACQAIPASCSTAPQGESDYLLPCLVRAIISSPPSAPPTRTPWQRNSHLWPPLPGQYPWLKRQHPLPEPQEHIYRQAFPKGQAGGTIQFQEMGDSHLVCLTQTQSCRGL